MFLYSGFHEVNSGLWYWIPDSLMVEHSIVKGDLDSLRCIPDSKAQDSRFHKKDFGNSRFHKQKFSGFHNPVPDGMHIII